MPGYTKRVFMAHLNKSRSVNTVNDKNGCMDFPTLMALSLKLSILWQVPTELAKLAKSLSTTLMVMSYMVNHAGVVYHTLESVTCLEQ